MQPSSTSGQKTDTAKQFKGQEVDQNQGEADSDTKGKSVEAKTSALTHLDSAKDVFVEQVNEITNRVMALTPKTGVLHNMGEFFSDRLLKTTTYLGEHTSTQIGGEVLALLKKNYLPIVGSVVGAGIGAAMSRKMANRTHGSARKEGGSKSATSQKKSTKVIEATTH